MQQASLKITKTRQIRNPTYYVEAINGDYADFALDEDRAREFRGEWRSQAFKVESGVPLDVEVGIGVGYFFAHHARNNPQRVLVGIELKFKPLIQSLRRALNQGAKNIKGVRYHAHLITDLFTECEIDNVYIHHPDPWTKRKKNKHRLLNSEFLSRLFTLQKPGGFLEIKTDSHDYFLWLLEEIKNSPYKIIRQTEDLHTSVWQDENFVTQFEQFALNEGKKICYLRATKSEVAV